MAWWVNAADARSGERIGGSGGNLEAEEVVLRLLEALGSIVTA